MKPRTFVAPSIAEALEQVKETLGGDAIILHTRTVTHRRWLGLRRQEMYEITAGRGSELATLRRPARRPQEQRPPAAATAAAAGTRRPASRVPAAAGAAAGAAAVAKSGAAAPARRDPSPSAASSPGPAAGAATAAAGPGLGQELLATPAGSTAVIRTITHELTELKAMVKEVVESHRRQCAPQVPEDLFEHYVGLLQGQVADELARDVVKNVQAHVRPEHLRNPAFVREKIAEQLEKLLPVAGPLARTKATGPHVVALVGPTGVGKTTTVAKLAANLKLVEHRRVGLVTIDTYRIAAVDQLRKYADIIGSPLEVVTSPDELRAALATMADCEFVLIDTAGRSPTDALKLSELRGFLAAARPDEVHLVLSSTASQECVESAVKHFSEVGVNRVLFTKLDEAVHVGVLLNVVRKVNLSLSYITTGQDVPDDIEEARGRRLAQLILGGAL